MFKYIKSAASVCRTVRRTAVAVCAALLASALFVGAAPIGSTERYRKWSGTLYGGKAESAATDSASGGRSTLAATGGDSAGALAESGATFASPVPDTPTDDPESPAADSAISLGFAGLADALSGAFGAVRRTLDAVTAQTVALDAASGELFAVTRAADGSILCEFDSFARFAGATEVLCADGVLCASGGGFDVTLGEGDEYVMSSGRAFWAGETPVCTDEGTFVSLASLAPAFGYTVGEDGETICGGGAIVSADEYYDATDLYWLSHIIYAESGCEPMLGKIAVGNVVLNRVRSEAYPDTVYGVIFDCRYGAVQFSPTASGTIYLEPSEDAVIAAKICLEGYSLSDEIEFFFNPEISDTTWISDTRPWIMTIAHHAFYG